MSRLKKVASNDISSRILDQIDAFANDTGSADSYHERISEMLRQEIDRAKDQELENLDNSVQTALDVVGNIEYAMGLIKTALERAQEDISDKR